MRTLALRNYKTFQHYKDRRPPWVKFHVDFLDDPDLSELSPATRLVAALLTLIASVKDNRIPESPAWLAAECNVSVREAKRALADLLAINYLVCASELASTDASETASESAPEPLAPRADPRARGEAETETEKDTPTPRGVADDVFAVFRETWSPKARLTDKRRRLVKARLKDGFTADDLTAAIRGAKRDPWPERPKFATFELLLRDAEHIERFAAMAAGTNGTATIGQPGYKPSTPGEQAIHDRILNRG